MYAYHVAEHHHSPLCLAPNQAVYLAAVAERTSRLRFGPLVYVLPLHHPIRLIEEICMVDQLSDGRYQVGVGAGTGGGTEFAMWGGDPSENHARFEETLEVVAHGLQAEFLTHHGEHFDFQDVWMELRPRQLPHPPFWYAGNPEQAARRGMNFIGAGSISGIAAAADRYRQFAAEAPPANDIHPPEDPLIGAMKHVFIADTDEEAQERAAVAWENYRTHFPKPSPEGGPATRGAAGAFNEAAQQSALIRDTANEGARRGGPAALDGVTAIERHVLLAGSPATVRDYVARIDADTGANYFVGAFQFGDLTHAESSRSLELFASEVMPAFME